MNEDERRSILLLFDLWAINGRSSSKTYVSLLFYFTFGRYYLSLMLSSHVPMGQIENHFDKFSHQQLLSFKSAQVTSK